jgi:hypothetical protein
MDIVPVSFKISEQEFTSSKGSIRDMLIEKGFRPISEQHSLRSYERTVYALEEVREPRTPRAATPLANERTAHALPRSLSRPFAHPLCSSLPCVTRCRCRRSRRQ